MSVSPEASQADRTAEREARLAAIVASSPDAMVSYDLQGHIYTWNHGAERLFGYTEAEALGRSNSMLVPPELRAQEPLGAFPRALRGEVVHGHETVRLAKNGRRIQVVLSAARLLCPDGRTIGVFISFRDITDRKRAEAALRQSEALKSAILQGALDCVITIDDEGRIVEWNSAAEHTFGQTRDLVIGRELAGVIVPPEHREAHRNGLARYLATGEGRLLGRRIEVEALRANGSRFPVELAITPSHVGGKTLFTAYLRDITERKRAEDALGSSEARLQRLLATLDLAAVFVRDFDGTIRFWSRGCERLYGWTRSEAVGRISHDLLETIFPVPLADVEAALLRDGEWSGDLGHRRRDGALITVAVRKVLRRDAEGRRPAIMESVADVTALREAEIALRHLNEELEARVQQEVVAREAVQSRLAQAEKLTALGQLAGGISHDFNNVLQIVSGGINLIRRRAEDPASVRRLARMVEEAAQRGGSVTRRLLAFARRGELRPEPVDLAELLDGVREVLGHTLGASVCVQTKVSADLPPVLADRGQLETALVNLATNARDAMPTGGTLVFSAAAEIVTESGHPERLVAGEYLCLSVADTGTGMDGPTLARALEPFFTTKEPGKGTGLGLSIARSFAEQSGGALAVASEPGRGTTVRVWLPVAEGALSKAKEEQPVRPPAAGPRRVLIVDDEPLVREVLAEELENCGYEVVQADRGSAALALLEQGAPVDLLISDLSMPEMDGVAVIRAAQQCKPFLPTILLTGFAGEAAGLAATGIVNGGPFALLRKPVSTGELADRVAALLAGSGSAPEQGSERAAPPAPIHAQAQVPAPSP